MYLFDNDYSEGAHPNILKAIVTANLDQTLGYGEDAYTKKAQDMIRELVASKDADVYFITGGTLTNIVVLSHILRPYEAVIATDEAHIYTHETGAIEATGHKVIALDNVNGKLDVDEVEKVILAHKDHHMVLPKVLFVSNATELGTIYSRAELIALKELAVKYDMYLYLDGARLAVALASTTNDLTYQDIGMICDVFYIGGTKNGALFGEALVVVNDDLKKNFNYSIKQKGALFAKGKFLAIQFIELYTNDLSVKLARHANAMAQKISDAFSGNGYRLYTPTQINQVFVVVNNDKLDLFNQQFQGQVWGPFTDTSSIVRYTTSWATKHEQVDNFVDLIAKNVQPVGSLEDQAPVLSLDYITRKEEFEDQGVKAVDLDEKDKIEDLRF